MKTAIVLFAVLALAMSHEFLDQASLSSEVNNMKSTWRAGHNHYFDGMNMVEIKTLMGTILETPEELKLPEIEITPLEDIPTNFNSAEQWPGCESLKEIRDQATCGSCWAFGAVEAMSDRLCIHSGQKDQTRISSEDLLTCCGMTCGQGCNGGYPSGAWRYFQTAGLVTGDLHDDKQWCKGYTFPACDHHVSGKYGPCGASKPTPKCVHECTGNSSLTYTSDKHKGLSSYSVPSSVDKIQTEIMTNGPIEVAFTVYADFLTYKTGVYEHKTGSALGGHAVKMVGWGVENGTPYWLVANSWNEGWGDNGYFKIIRGKNHCGIESQGVAGKVTGMKMEQLRLD